MSSEPSKLLMMKFYERKTRNPSYSMRAFSRDLDLSSGALSELLSKKRRLTVKKAKNIAARLFNNPVERDQFLAYVTQETDSKTDSGILNGLHILSHDAFQIIADWQHYAIMNLVETEDFDCSPDKIGKRLGISSKVAKESVERLIRSGLLVKRGGSLKRKDVQISTDFDHMSSALRHSHRQSLEQAICSIDRNEVDEREFISCTLSFDPCDMKKAKTLIREFATSFKASLPRRRKTEVYNMNIQLVPVTQLRRSREN